MSLEGVLGSVPQREDGDDEVEVRRIRKKSRGEMGREKVIKSHFARIGSDREVGVLRIGGTRYCHQL